MSFIDNVRDLVEMPEGFKPGYADLLEAVEASCIWAILENENPKRVGFSTMMDVCSYAEWCCDKALGRPHKEEWEGVPHIVLVRRP